MSPEDRNDQGDGISLAEASRLAGVSASTLRRWADAGLVPVADGRWTRASAAQGRVIARMRERGYSVDAIREAARGRPARVRPRRGSLPGSGGSATRARRRRS